MSYAYGMRLDDDSNAITVIDEDEQTAVTTGYVNGEYVEFSGGGGGSSDLSIATVTIVNNKDTTITVVSNDTPIVVEANELGEGTPAMVFPALSADIEAGTSTQFKVPLYKGNCYWDMEWSSTYSVTGDITDYEGTLLITGDGTITYE